MPQDSLRSVVYRSFVTCDDPKGVADCNKTIRKSKKTQQKIKKTSPHGEEELCFQVMEVSRGAERLNQVADRPSSEHIATDLLRGALHLRHSLVMLGKLHKASDFIATKHKEKRPLDLAVNGGGGDDDKPRVSASRDCYDELREVIRESFARQNLLPKEKLVCDVDRKHSELCVDLPSSSSSQASSSSLLLSRSSGCSPSYSVRHERTKQGSSNLIAKLMGLEEVPYAAREEGIPFRRSPLLDIDLPRPNKPQFMVQKTVRERRTLEEIIETMQFKGILGRKSVDGSNALFLRKDLAANSPPIVIMKPLHDHCINGGEHMIKSKQMPRKMREEELPPTPQLKDSAADRSSKQKLDRSKEGKVRVRPPVKKAALDSLSTTKMKQPKPPLPQMQKKEAPRIRKPADAKPQIKPNKTQDLAKLATLKHTKTVRGNNVSKTQVARGKVSAVDKGMKPTSLSRTVTKKSHRRGESNSKPSSPLVENAQSKGNAISIETKSLVKNTEPEQTTGEVAKAYYMPDNSTNAASSPSDASGLITKDDPDHIEDDSCVPSVDSDEIKGCKSMMNSRYLLLSSASFLNHIEELFDTGTHDSTVFQTDSELLHDSLLLDCAKEILERKSLSNRSTRNPWSQNLLRRPKYHLSMEQLVEEISDTIEDLQNYSKYCGDVVVADSIYPMLDRDLRRNEEVTGAWDSGWRKGYAMEAVDEVMHDLEEQVLSEIVADVIIQIMQ
ncbi:uncharacterized protein LOC130985530 [Salvia miltiorrhiza]|uniref:uncharacterized protein LOC130985530 n=1 Tax=Salvia miltiorrhiza TaxID=226208 RepID=UPI0025AD728E|nr:uncharacterized protein LOC130985530 [Salvia miltiorrhiza]XP_057764540.1 uncharacterized protein LOC130985530 [Salvia miltiorrhiza]XP_057764548.1 uncharacterized protein LOC130985530 [Salvia miltiorrhiza]XP_057764555.1 uncharacterized protein LOC130985530 [Salvia miltiorrhiza]